MLLTRLPLYSQDCSQFLVRLACVRHAASVDSEPGSNSPFFLNEAKSLQLPTPLTLSGSFLQFVTGFSLSFLFSSVFSILRIDYSGSHYLIFKELLPLNALCISETRIS